MQQTSYADMLDLAVQHIKGLQNQVQVCKSTLLRSKQNNSMIFMHDIVSQHMKNVTAMILHMIHVLHKHNALAPIALY